MQVYVTAAGKDELFEVLTSEGVTYEQRMAESQRELGTGSFEVYEIRANVPEVKVPPEYSQGEVGARAFRLPSGKLIITDLEGSLEQITQPVPSKP
ncbi:MAG: hypothetical protein ACOC6K_03770 [Thermodesulfobacteriota bacterium]